jgi:hypothetical protein
MRHSSTNSSFFMDNRVRSCSYVKATKKGLKAVPFYDKRDNYIYPTQSKEKYSWSSIVHANAHEEHAGGGMDKTLSNVSVR